MNDSDPAGPSIVARPDVTLSVPLPPARPTVKLPVPIASVPPLTKTVPVPPSPMYARAVPVATRPSVLMFIVPVPAPSPFVPPTVNVTLLVAKSTTDVSAAPAASPTLITPVPAALIPIAKPCPPAPPDAEPLSVIVPSLTFTVPEAAPPPSAATETPTTTVFAVPEINDPPLMFSVPTPVPALETPIAMVVPNGGGAPGTHVCWSVPPLIVIEFPFATTRFPPSVGIAPL